jgi:integrase
MLAALTGMRRGELCAHRWSDVDLKLGALEVSRSVVVVVGGVAEMTTKTDRSLPVALDAVGVALMQRYHKQVLGWLKDAGGKSLPPDAFVSSPVVDSLIPFHPDNVTSFCIRVRDEVGAPNVRLHDLRHFTATQLIGAGVDVRTVAGRLGNSDPSLTLRIYSLALEERDRAAATIMGNVLSAKRKKPAQFTSAG